ARMLGVSPHHLVNIVASHRSSRELAGPPRGRAKEIDGLPFSGPRVPRPLLLLDTAPLEVVIKENLQVMGDGDLSRLPSLLVEVKHPLVAGLMVVVPFQRGHRSDSGARVGERLDDELVPK